MATETHPLKRWVEALESGDYQQVRKILAATVDPALTGDQGVTGYCCLGVACNIYAEDHPEARWEGYEFHAPWPDNMDEESTDEQVADGELPYIVREWLGIYVSEEGQYITLNDAEKFSFEQIAKEVRVRHPEVFDGSRSS